MELLTSAQMRAVEQAAISSGSITGLALMDRAGRGVVDAVFAAWPELAVSPRSATILCGPGNNGGDGFVIARRLKDLGWEVEVFLYGAPYALPADARKMYELWADMGDILPMDPARAAQGVAPALLIDAMFGTGLTRPIPRDCARAFHAVRGRKGVPRDTRTRAVAVDVPSGMDADSGVFLVPAPPTSDSAGEDAALQAHAAYWQNEVQPRILPCELCVTFHRAKPAHYLTEVSGRRRPAIVDIGLPEGAVIGDVSYALGAPKGDDRVRLICPAQDQRASGLEVWLKHTAFGHIGGSHKYDRGHVLVLGGGAGHGGAARLAARSALRVGAGLVTLGVPHEALAENAAQLNAIMLREIGDATALAKTLKDERLTALCIGPGLGVGQGARDLVIAALAASDIRDGTDRRRYVLDADALTAFAQAPDTLFAMLHGACILTPHEGEFARLFPDLAEKCRQPDRSSPPMSKVEAARAAAKRAGCTILLKGPATVIASPDGTASIHAALYDRRADWLGTAGAGDVLAGLIAGLMANSMVGGMSGGDIHQRVEVAAYLHVEAARSFGAGLIAEDLPEALPKVLRAARL